MTSDQINIVKMDWNKVHYPDEWVRISSMAFDLYEEFMFVEHDVETIQTLDESVTSAEVKKLLLKHFPMLFTEENYKSRVDVEFRPWAQVFGEDEDVSDDELGLATYVYFHGIVVTELYQRFIDKYPELIIKHYL